MIFTDRTMMLAAVDRLVHHATILEMNIESYRRKSRAQTQAWRRRLVVRRLIPNNRKLQR